jgi:hypothetical protein
MAARVHTARSDDGSPDLVTPVSRRCPDMQTLDWDEIEPAAREAFRIWSSGSDFDWAKEVWSRLVQAGFCDYESAQRRHLVIARFLALASIYRDWCAVAFDESHADEPQFWVEDLEIEPFYLGQLVREPLGDDPDDAIAGAWAILLHRERPRVVQALLTVYGGQVEGLFVALHHSVKSLFEADDDEDCDEADTAVLNEPSAANLAGYAWIVDGCPNVRPVC